MIWMRRRRGSGHHDRAKRRIQRVMNVRNDCIAAKSLANNLIMIWSSFRLHGSIRQRMVFIVQIEVDIRLRLLPLRGGVCWRRWGFPLLCAALLRQRGFRPAFGWRFFLTLQRQYGRWSRDCCATSWTRGRRRCARWRSQQQIAAI